MWWDCLRGTGPLTGPLSIPQMIYEWIWSSGGTILLGETQRTRRKICPSANLSTATWTNLGANPASAVRTRRLTAWAIRSLPYLVIHDNVILVQLVLWSGTFSLECSKMTCIDGSSSCSPVQSKLTCALSSYLQCLGPLDLFRGCTNCSNHLIPGLPKSLFSRGL
jgi:hypothetical protein